MSTRYRRVVVPSYSYERTRLVRSYLRKVPGKSRRVRVNVLESFIVEVEGYSYEIPISRLQRKRPKAPATSPKKRAKAKALRPSPKRPSRRPTRRHAPRPYEVSEAQAREEQLEAIRRGLTDAPKDEWQNVVEFTEAIETQKSFDGYDVTEMERIYHAQPATDWVHLPTLFVWPIKTLPYKLDLSKRFSRGKTPFQRLRIWFWVRYDGIGEDAEEGEEVRLWSRSGTFPIHVFADSFKYKNLLWEKVIEDMDAFNALPSKKGETPKGWTPIELVAWTAYRFDEKMPTNQKQTKKEGTSD